MKSFITTECVGYGHPDKIADQISDSLLDGYIRKDSTSKVAIETMVKDNIVVLGGEVTSSATIDTDKTVREVFSNIIFSNEHNLKPENIKIINLIGKQSPEINKGVFKEDGEIGSGDQGIMFGYATNETDNYMPVGMYVARKLVNMVCDLYPNMLGPDCKSQVTIENECNKSRIHTILISTQHNTNISLDEVKELLVNSIYGNKMDLSSNIYKLIDCNTIIKINPAGSWNIGGPISDCGMTGRKIVVDQYGPYCPVGGGAFCFEGNTLVKIGNGEYKKIKDIKEGDEVFTVNETTNQIEVKTVNKLFKKSKEDSYNLLELVLENGDIIKITENHEVKTNRGWVMAKDLCESDDIIDLNSFLK